MPRLFTTILAVLCGMLLMAFAIDVKHDRTFANNRKDSQKQVYISPTRSSAPYCGLSSLKVLLACYGKNFSLSHIASVAGVGSGGSSVGACMRAADYYGVPCDLQAVSSADDIDTSKPNILILDSVNNKHAVVLLPKDRDSYYLVDGPAITVTSRSDLQAYLPCVAIVPRVSIFNPKGD